MSEEIKAVGNIEEEIIEVNGNCKKSKFKILFCKWGMKLESGEIVERVWQHNTEYVDGSKAENKALIFAINEFKKNVFGEIKQKFTRDTNFFHGKEEVYEVVVDPEIPEVIERAHWKAANFKRQFFNPDNFNPIIPKPAKKNHNPPKKEVGQPLTKEEYSAFTSKSLGTLGDTLDENVSKLVHNLFKIDPVAIAADVNRTTK